MYNYTETAWKGKRGWWYTYLIITLFSLDCLGLQLDELFDWYRKLR